MSKIKTLRIAEGLTVRQLAEKSKVAVGYISTLENDDKESTNPSKQTMCRISEALGKSVVEVFFSGQDI